MSAETNLTWHQQRAAETRLAIIEAAQEVFLRDGYAASMDTLAAAANVSRRTLYQRFGSKEAIFRAMMDKLGDELISPMLDVQQEGDMLENLRTIARKFVELTCSPTLVAVLRLCVAEARRFPDSALEFYNPGVRRVVPVLARYLRKGMADGVIRSGNPMVMAEQFLACVVGYRQYRALFGVTQDDHAQDEDYIANAITLVANDDAGHRKPNFR